MTAVVTPPTIPAITATPQPGSATFNADAVAWMDSQRTALPVLQQAADATATNATLAESSAAQALAASAFKGAWSSLTGALAMPACVTHNGKYWALLQPLANVTTQTPALGSAYWSLIPTASTGAETAQALYLSQNFGGL